jgi:hypothetical protein
MLVNMERFTSAELFFALTRQGALVVETREQGLRRATALVRKYIPEGVNLSEELIAERRAEALRELRQHP